MKLRVAIFSVILVAFLILFKSCSTQAATHSITLIWVAPGPIAGATYTYNIQRSNVAGGPYTPVKNGISALTYTDQNLAANTKYCYVATVSAIGFQDSVPSNEVCGTTPQDTAPNASGLAITSIQ